MPGRPTIEYIILFQQQAKENLNVEFDHDDRDLGFPSDPEKEPTLGAKVIHRSPKTLILSGYGIRKAQ